MAVYKEPVKTESEDPPSKPHAAPKAAESAQQLAAKQDKPKALATPSKNKNEDTKEYTQLWKGAVRLRSEIQSSMS